MGNGKDFREEPKEANLHGGNYGEKGPVRVPAGVGEMTKGFIRTEMLINNFKLFKAFQVNEDIKDYSDL